MTQSLLVLDAPSLYYRAFHGAPASITGPDGTPVNAVRGFLDYVARMLRERRPDRFVAAMDADWRPEWRVALIPAYKLHRVADDGSDGAPDDLSPQVPIIEQCMVALGLASYGVAGYEADDVIGTLTHTADGPVDVVTGDRDLFQLARDEPYPVRIVYSVDKFRAYGPAEIEAKYGIPGTAYAEFALIRGDASDGLPGVAGIGDKGAAALVTRWGSVAAVLAAIDEGVTEGMPAGTRTKLSASRDYLAAADPVVRVATDVPLPPADGAHAVDDRVPGTPADPERLLELADAYGLHSPVERVLQALEVVRSR